MVTPMKKLIVAADAVALASGAVARSRATATGNRAQGAGTIVNTAKDNASAAACATNRAQLAEQISMAQSSSEGKAPDLAAIVAELKVTCPSGGAYAFDQATGRVACSVHGE